MEFLITVPSGKKVKIEVDCTGFTIYGRNSHADSKYAKQQAKKLNPINKLHWLNFAKRGIATWELHVNGQTVSKILFSERKNYKGLPDKMPIMRTPYISLEKASKLGWL